MRILKSILLLIVSLIVLLLIVGLFTKKEYAVEREVIVNKPRQEVFNYVKYLKNQDYYSVWNMKDPAARKTYRGSDGTVGFVSTWDSDSSDIGKGEQEIKKIQEGSRLDMELRFIKPFEATDYAYLATEDAGANQTKVKWGFYGKMNYPMNLMLVFMDMNQMLGSQLQQGLDNLKANLEKQ